MSWQFQSKFYEIFVCHSKLIVKTQKVLVNPIATFLYSLCIHLNFVIIIQIKGKNEKGKIYKVSLLNVRSMNERIVFTVVFLIPRIAQLFLLYSTCMYLCVIEMNESCITMIIHIMENTVNKITTILK